MADAKPITVPAGATGVLVLASGEVVWGRGFGAEGQAVGEVCFHTAMTGYQEIMTDPSFAGQMICFTFPHIGNVGANPDDVEADDPHALGMIVREDVTAPSNFRSVEPLDAWMAKHNRIGLSGIDTRALTRRIRGGGAPNGVIAHSASGEFDVPALLERARGWPGLEGMDLAVEVTTATHFGWGAGEGEAGAGETGAGGIWRLGDGYGKIQVQQAGARRPHVVAIDYGSKRNIFRNLAHAGAEVSVVPAGVSFEQVMALEPDGIFLSNGPGDPAATGEYAVPVIRQLLETGKPLFGICLGHQLLALAVGGRTTKMFQGHRGANHPVKRLSDGAVEITSMNHGFAVERGSLPEGVRETHVSLFDGSNAGLELDGGRAFSVQYHPEASPGPQDSLYLFERFVGMLGTPSTEQADAWSLEDYLAHGTDAVEKIRLDIAGIDIDPRVCFHFGPTWLDESEVWGEDAAYCRVARPYFDALPFALDVDYVGGTSGIEAWETRTPSVEWLHQRIAPLTALAQQANLVFQGWSFEPSKPRDFSFVSCGPHLDVVNRYSPEGQAAVDEMMNVKKAEE